MYNLKIGIMRKMFIYLWVMICSLGFAACANDSGDDQAGESYKVSKITAHYYKNDDNDGDEILVFNYDNQGKIITCTCNGDQITYTYKNDQITISESGNNKQTLKLNEKGYVSQSNYKNDDETATYTYDALGQISKINWTYTTSNFTWSEGNIAKEVYNNSTGTYNYSATYNYSSVENKANFDFSSFLSEYFGGDEYEYCGLLNGSYFGKQNKNLVTNCQEIENGEMLNCRYEYIFNKNGCVEKISQYENNVLTVTYTVEYL